MAPKAKAPVGLPALPPEPSPDEHLPQDIRDMVQAPFPVTWKPVISLMEFSHAIKPAPLRNTLKHKEIARMLLVGELVARLEPDGQLVNDMLPAQEAHVVAGGTFETFVPAPHHAAEVLKVRFERDQRADWRIEFHRRRTALKEAEDELKIAEETKAAAFGELESATVKLDHWRQAKEAERVAAAAAAEEDGDDGIAPEPSPAVATGGEEEEVELSKEEEEFQGATSRYQDSESAFKVAEAALASLQTAMETPFVFYQNYWVAGLGSTVEAIEGVCAGGVPIRAAIWGHVAATPPPDDADAAETPAEGAEVPAAPVPLEPPALYSGLKDAVQKAGWDSNLSLLVTLEIELPPSPEEVAPPVEAPDPKKKAPPAKGAKEEPPPPPAGPPPDAPGWETLSELLSDLKFKARAYDEWRASVKVCNALGKATHEPPAALPNADGGDEPAVPDTSAPPTSDSMAYYTTLLAGVEPERLNVPVIMHALLEQVARNMAGDEAVEEGEQAAAETLALDALSQAFSVFGAENEGSVFSGGQAIDYTDGPYTLVNEGDDLGLAAAGFTSGHVRAIPSRKPTASVAQNRYALPTSPLDGEESVRPDSPPMFIPGSGVLDVNSIESYMLSLLKVPGVSGFGIEEHPPLDPVTKALRDASVRAQADPTGTPLAAVQRYEVLQAAADLLPPSAKLAQEAGILGRHHTEALLPGMLKQVVHKAQTQLPHSAFSYNEHEGCVVLSCFAGSNERRDGGGLPVAVTFSTYYDRAAALKDEVLEMPSLVYQVVPELRESAEQGVVCKYQFGDDGTIVSTGKGISPASLSKGSTTVVLSAVGSGANDTSGKAPKLLATLDGGATICAYRADTPAIPITAAAVGDEPIKSTAEDGADVDAAPPPEPPIPEPPVLSIQVTTPKGASIEINTDGIAHLVPPPSVAGPTAPSKSRGVAVHGAPIPSGENLTAPPSIARRSVLQDGSLVNVYADGSSIILHADGTISERLALVEGYVYPDGSDAGGWIRTLLDGTRFREPDDICFPRPPPPPPPPPPEPEPEDPKKAAKGGKGAKVVEEPPPPPPPLPPPPPPPPPRQLELSPISFVELTDPATGSHVIIRSDNLMRIAYPSGEQLLLAPDGTRLSRVPGGAWAVEFEAGIGALPSVYGNALSGEGIRTTAFPGLELSATGGVVTCQLPDGSLVLVGGPLGAFIPAEKQARGANASSFAYVLGNFGGDQDNVVDAIADIPEWNGSTLIDLVSGRAALSGCKEDGSPFGFRLGIGTDEVEFWPEAPPLSWLEYPEPPPPPPETTPKADEDGDNPDAATTTADGGLQQEQGMGDDDEDEEGKKSKPPPPPPPPPIKHVNPVAQGVIPRVFVVFPSGDGYEVLDPSVMEALSNRAAGGGPLLASVDLDVRPLPGAREPGVTVHSLLAQMPQTPPEPQPLPIGVVALVQKYNPHMTELFPALRRTSRQEMPELPQGGDSPFSGGSGQWEPKKWQYIPRICAYEPPRTRAPPSSPVLAYREIVEHPCLQPPNIRVIREVLEAVTGEDKRKAEWRENAVPLEDPREDKHKAAEEEVLSMILDSRKQREARAAASAEAVRSRQRHAEGEDAGRIQAEASEAALVAAAMEKELRPWPAKVGPYDHTPKRPTEGNPISYWKAEEGLVAADSDPSLGEGAPVLTRKMLPPRMPPSSYATPGMPSPIKSGVYISDRAKQLAEAQAEAQAAEAENEHISSLDGPLPNQKSGGLSSTQRSSQFGKSGGRNSKLQPIDYHYPELGRTAVAQQQATLKATNPKSCRLDVYGQPRGEMPRMFRQDEAEASLNDRYLEVEGGPLRATKNSSASLIRLAGKAGRQFTLSPSHVHFGNVPAGSVSHKLARLQNVSTGIARYSVIRPDPALRVISKPGPGPVVPGSEALLTIEFQAPQAPGDFVSEIVIKTEVNVFTLTVSARVVAPGGGPGSGVGGSMPPRVDADATDEGKSSPTAAGGERDIVLDETKSLEEMLAQPPLA